MREHRFDPFTGDGVVLCDDHPAEAAPPLPADGPVPCALCPGHEARTGRTLDAVDGPDGSWSARAVAHRIPVLRVEATGETHQEGPWLRADGLGAHEVLVESPDHAPLHEQPPWRSAAALTLLARRLADLRGDRRLATVAWWREEGLGPCHHPAAQLLALPYVPEALARSVALQVGWAARHGGSLARAVVAAEEADGRRLVWSGRHAVAVCPWAPRAAFEVWVVPRLGGPSPADEAPEVLADVAAGVRAARRAIARALGPVPVVTSAVLPPVAAPPAAAWLVRVRPRLRVSGVDEAAGTPVVGVFPEEAAHVLRSALASAEPAVP